MTWTLTQAGPDGMSLYNSNRGDFKAGQREERLVKIDHRRLGLSRGFIKHLKSVLQISPRTKGFSLPGYDQYPDIRVFLHYGGSCGEFHRHLRCHGVYDPGLVKGQNSNMLFLLQEQGFKLQVAQLLTDKNKG